jgi:hypothetical protein
MRTTVAGIVLLGLLTAAPAAAHGQRIREHSGFWISPSLGMALTFSDPAYEELGDDSELDLSLSLRMGGSLSQQVLIGGESAVWGSGDRNLRGHVAATLIYYPSSTGGLFARALAGIAYRVVG